MPGSGTGARTDAAWLIAPANGGVSPNTPDVAPIHKPDPGASASAPLRTKAPSTTYMPPLKLFEPPSKSRPVPSPARVSERSLPLSLMSPEISRLCTAALGVLPTVALTLMDPKAPALETRKAPALTVIPLFRQLDSRGNCALAFSSAADNRQGRE